MKILFFGTPKFAEIVLDGLLKSTHKVVGVVCQTDKPSGRGKVLQSPHIVEIAKQNNLQVLQYDCLKDHLDDFARVDADIFVTASYGKILPKGLLDQKLCINVHPSLLPKYRGATPIQSAILAGDTITGVSIMKTEVGMDDGDIFTQEAVKILPDEDYNSLMPRLAEVGLRLLLQTLQNIENGTATRTPQNEKDATFVRPIEKADALLDFQQPAGKLCCKVRAFVENPTAFFCIGGQRIKVFKARVLNEDEENSLKALAHDQANNIARNAAKDSAHDFSKGIAKDITPKNMAFSDNSFLAGGSFLPGEIIFNKKRFLVQTGSDVLEILRCQAAGGKVLDAGAFLNGFRFFKMAVDA